MNSRAAAGYPLPYSVQVQHLEKLLLVTTVGNRDVRDAASL
jgi:hypothetical protein